MFVNGLGRKSNIYKGPYIDAYYEVSVHLAKRFQWRRFFRNQPIRNKNCLWWPYLLMDRDKMNNLYKGPSYQVSVHLAEGFQRRRLKCEKLRMMDAKWWQGELKTNTYLSFYNSKSRCHKIEIDLYFMHLHIVKFKICNSRNLWQYPKTNKSIILCIPIEGY